MSTATATSATLIRTALRGAPPVCPPGVLRLLGLSGKSLTRATKARKIQSANIGHHARP
jgi:hypothetical protein